MVKFEIALCVNRPMAKKTVKRHGPSDPALSGFRALQHVIEQNNLSMRMSMRRFTRLTNAFSKKVENHAHAVALYFLHYNFARIHKTLRVTPAMARRTICGALRKSSPSWTDALNSPRRRREFMMPIEQTTNGTLIFLRCGCSAWRLLGHPTGSAFLVNVIQPACDAHTDGGPERVWAIKKGELVSPFTRTLVEAS